MNWDLILTTVGMFITVVVFTPFFIAYLLAYQKSRMHTDLEALQKHQKLFHPSSDLDWTQFYEGETK